MIEVRLMLYSYIKDLTISHGRAAEILGIGKMEVMIPGAVYDDLLLMDEAKGRQVARQMGIKIMGTIGILFQAYQSQLLDKEQILHCIDVMRASGRQISENLYRQLINRLEQ